MIYSYRPRRSIYIIPQKTGLVNIKESPGSGTAYGETFATETDKGLSNGIIPQNSETSSSSGIFLNVFQKLFDEIKRLWRLATAGSKEKRQLEKAKNLFEDAIRENAKAKSETDLKGEDLAKKNEIGTAKYSVSIDNKVNNEYNDYTQTEDFYKRVPYTMQSDFRVYLSHKTNGMAEGETRTFYNCGFIFKATGYMQGKILAKYSNRTKKLLYESEASYESINTNTRGSSVWSETIQYADQRRSGDNGLSRGGDGASGNDVLFSDTQRSYTSGDNEQIWRHSGTEREPSELVKNLLKKLETWGDEPLEVDEDISRALSGELNRCFS